MEREYKSSYVCIAHSESPLDARDSPHSSASRKSLDVSPASVKPLSAILYSLPRKGALFLPSSTHHFYLRRRHARGDGFVFGGRRGRGIRWRARAAEFYRYLGRCLSALLPAASLSSLLGNFARSSASAMCCPPLCSPRSNAVELRNAVRRRRRRNRRLAPGKWLRRSAATSAASDSESSAWRQIQTELVKRSLLFPVKIHLSPPVTRLTSRT